MSDIGRVSYAPDYKSGQPCDWSSTLEGRAGFFRCLRAKGHEGEHYYSGGDVAELEREMERDVMIDTIQQLTRVQDEARAVLKEALEQTGCDGDLCAYRWHERARALIAEIEAV